MTKKILVTGGAGFIGSNLIKRLLKEGNKITSIDNLSIGSRDNYIDGVRYIEEDIRNIHLIEDEFDVCFHLAALSRIQPSFVSPGETYDNNTTGTQRVLEYCRHKDIQLIYAGSSSKHHNYFESPYATTKYLGEQLCKMYRDTYKMKIDIARFYNVYGEGEVVDGEWGAVIGIFRTQKKEGRPLTIVGDGEQTRDFTYVGDIVDGLIKISNSKTSHEDAWELGSGYKYSINTLASWFEHPTLYIPDQKGNYRFSLRVNNDTLERLDWKPQDRLKEYIKNL